MIWTADCIVHEGLALGGMGLRIGADGRIAEVAPVAQLPPPDVHLYGRAIMAGRIDPYHMSLRTLVRNIYALCPDAPLPRQATAGESAADVWAEALTPEDMYIVARAAFVRAVSCGITCLGEVYGLRYAAGGVPYRNPQAMLDAVAAAAQDVGVRLTVIDNVRLRAPGQTGVAQPARQSAPHFEVACAEFEALVHGLIERADARLSWALGAHSLDAVPYDALVALRVRLGHMPFFLAAPAHAGAQARAAASLGPHPLATLGRRDVLDASVTIVCEAAPSQQEMTALAEAGTTTCLALNPAGQLALTPLALMRAGGGRPMPCIATGGSDPAALAQAYADWPVTADTTPDANIARLATQMNVAAGQALGADVGALRPGSWGDFCAVTLPEGLCVPSQSQAATEGTRMAQAAAILCRHLLTLPPQQVVTDAVIGGVPVLQGGSHPLVESSQHGIAALAARLAAGN
jgi:hypothetical protein